MWLKNTKNQRGCNYDISYPQDNSLLTFCRIFSLRNKAAAKPYFKNAFTVFES
ncbi:hypothetical protein MTBLM1_40026 [Rhodospirillaceae bacterium LM-1]|nr:hypothetical protein MTBLM1_40026 [Rhodospirillaceae bacterium LM-1]